MKMRYVIAASVFLALFALLGCWVTPKAPPTDTEVSMNETEWKEKLTEEQYYVCRQKGTEQPFTGKYVNHKEDGTYTCVACGEELFSSKTKYDSRSGWPSFYDAIEKGNIRTEQDSTLGVVRTEIMCAKCGSHLGHVFDDGPQPTGLRYCVNSASLDFVKKEE